MTRLPGLKALAPVWSRVTNIVAKEARGAWITDVNGRKWLDFTTGIAVCNTGHCHPRVVSAAQQQLSKIMHAQMNIVYSESAVKLAESLQDIMPDPSLNRFFFTNSGAEAIEAAVKLAKQVTKKNNIICFENSFHGRTMGALSMTASKNVYSRGGGQVPGIHFARFPRCSSSCRIPASSGEPCCWDPIDSVEDVLKTRSAPGDTAAILVEPIQGEGGYVLPPPGFFKKLRELCDREGILLILDEVQSGMGRTGSWFAIEQLDDIRPDIMVVAKGIASGLPLSVVCANGESLMDKWIPGSHGGTYGGNAVSCAAAVETINVLRDEKLLENAVARGQQALDFMRVNKWAERFPLKDTRGLGLMIGIEFDPLLKGCAGKVTSAALEDGLMLMTAGSRETIRLMPPLVLSEPDMSLALSIIEKSMSRVFKK
ncbi:mitochondrial 4-aminobutyrate transaminase (alanine-glyoxylate aminotransferase (AGAT)) [Andalucia godoyi]|uniref:Mitochondrial 4-aminobutyrate transaminase (Alanine-glyoxylate aminotransferase (AGAT)) n=1 Tax=Andalucia godoyi TaxID=505711 RepID=A0A8K0F4A6_ANDGO|nr:mitochondrial 4-aminobutyrate transaminase (alanine-glyoxylate aminotransferase (AGAT)) [Andalucia godoyi]|eukprot:ANDGO_04226.mRNA.1 mitochondrial 4-aminobutyrate transaminase (alanine-glyoxylate aminotransferase (AGAT))